MEHDPLESTHTSPERIVEFDPMTESASATVTDAVAAQTGNPSPSLDSLDAVVDCEALDRLVRSVGRRSDAATAEIMFQYRGYTVTVHSYGSVELAPVDD